MTEVLSLAHGMIAIVESSVEDRPPYLPPKLAAGDHHPDCVCPDCQHQKLRRKARLNGH